MSARDADYLTASEFLGAAAIAVTVLAFVAASYALVMAVLP